MFQSCRRCGCSNFSACDGGCWWVEDDLCSSCVDTDDVAEWKRQEEATPGAWAVTESGLILPAGTVPHG